jgi:hypothetical protein
MQSAQKLWRAVLIGDQADETIPAGSLEIKRFAPLSLKVPTMRHTSETVVCEVELHAQLPWVWQDSEGGRHALILTGSGKTPPEPDKYVFEAVIFYLLCLSGEESRQWIGTSAMTLHVVYREKLVEWSYQFDPETARIYLTDLVADYLNQSMSAWLPFATATKLAIWPHKMADDQIDDLVRKNFAVELNDAYATVEDYLVRITKPAIPLDAFDRVRGRFKIFFEARS